MKIFHCFLLAILATSGTLVASEGNEPLVPEGEILDGGELLQQISWNSPVYAVAWSPDGQRLATGSGDGVVHLWDVTAGSEVMRLRESAFQELKVRSVDFNSKGDRICAAYDDGIVRVWELNKGLSKAKPTQLRGSIATWSLGKDFLALGLRSGTVQIWDGTEVFDLSSAHQDRVSALAWNTRDLLASGSWDGTIRIWNGLDRSLIRPLEGHELGVNSVAWNGDGTLLASASSDDTIRVWNVETGEQVRRFDGHQDSVLSVVWAADGKTLVSGSKDQTVRIWRLDRQPDLHETVLLGHEGAVHTVAVSPDGRLIASGSEDGTARVWAMTTQKEVLRLQGNASQVEALAFDRNGDTLAVAAGKVVRTWSLRTDATPSRAPGNLLLEGDKTLLSLAAGTEATVAAGYEEGTVEIWKEGQILSSTPAHNGSVLALAFRPDAKVLASGSEDRTFIVWDLEGSQRYPPVEVGRDDLISALAFSPDGKTLAVGSRVGRVRLWDVQNPEDPQEIGAPFDKKARILSLAFPSNDEIWALLEDRTIHAWNPATGASWQVRRLPERPSAVALSSDGHNLASVAFGERIVRVESAKEDGWRITQSLVGGAYDRRTWVACGAQGLCWRYDDGTLLLRENVGGELSPVLPSRATDDEPQIVLGEPTPQQLDILDGESAFFELSLTNVGEQPVYWLRVRQKKLSPSDPLISPAGSVVLHPPSSRPVLRPGERGRFRCQISAFTDFENPKEVESTLNLEVLSAQGEVLGDLSLNFRVDVPILAWSGIRISGSDSLNVVINNDGKHEISHILLFVELGEGELSTEVKRIDSIPPGNKRDISLALPDGVDLVKRLSARAIAVSSIPPLHRWTSDPQVVGGRGVIWGGLVFSIFLLITVSTLVQMLFGKSSKKSSRKEGAESPKDGKK